MPARVFLAAALLFVPAVLAAQTVDGAADWGWGRSMYRTGDEESTNGSFTQAYTLGYRSVFWDPRFLTYSGELTFNKNALTFGQQDSLSQQTGFKASANLFASRPFHGSIHASRGFGGESGNYPQSSAERSGLTLPAGSVPELKIGRSEFGVNWQLAAKSLPRIELSYDDGSTTVAAGSLEAVQRQRSVQALIAKDGPRLSNTLRYREEGFDSAVSQAFRQRFGELSYELTARASDRTWSTVRAGRRTTFSLFDVPPQFNDIGIDSYHPPPGGEVALVYGLATLTHQAAKGLSADVSVGYDREESTAAGTSALLATATTRYEPITGLTMHGSSTYGERGQDGAGARLIVLTRGFSSGADYTLTRRLVRGGIGFEAGRGWNTSERGEGESRRWRMRADAGTDVLRVVQLSTGYEQGRSLDDLLPLGNQWQERTHASLRSMLTARVMIDATYELASIDRGTAPQIFRTRYTQTILTTAIQLARDRRVTFAAGRFRNRAFTGDDDNEYIGIGFDGALIGLLRLSLTARRERTMSSAARLDQDGYYATAVLTYRLRLFTFSLEQRYTDLVLLTGNRVDPLTFTGNQILFRVGRKFGFAR
jgi:hypothetical protein